MVYKHTMPSRASKSKRPRDINLLARSVVEDLIGEKMDGSPLEQKPDTRNRRRRVVEVGRVQGRIGTGGFTLGSKAEGDCKEGGDDALAGEEDQLITALIGRNPATRS